MSSMVHYKWGLTLNIAWFDSHALNIIDFIGVPLEPQPEMFMFGGYISGVFPPGKKNLALAGKVLFNLLDAHVNVYLRYGVSIAPFNHFMHLLIECVGKSVFQIKKHERQR